MISYNYTKIFLLVKYFFKKQGILVTVQPCGNKVKDILPLEPYLIWTATWDSIGLASQVSTPKIFAEQADKQFQIVAYSNGLGK